MGHPLSIALPGLEKRETWGTRWGGRTDLCQREKKSSFARLDSRGRLSPRECSLQRSGCVYGLADVAVG